MAFVLFIRDNLSYAVPTTTVEVRKSCRFYQLEQYTRTGLSSCLVFSTLEYSTRLVVHGAEKKTLELEMKNIQINFTYRFIESYICGFVEVRDV